MLDAGGWGPGQGKVTARFEPGFATADYELHKQRRTMNRKLDLYLGSFLSILMAIMTLDVLWGVFTRYVMGSQASWTEELARFLLIWIGLLGAAYASGKRLHLAIDLLPRRLEGKAGRRLQIFINLTIMLFAATVMVIGGIRYVYITLTLGQTSPALQLPMGFVYIIIPVSGLLIIYYKAIELMNPARGNLES